MTGLFTRWFGRHEDDSGVKVFEDREFESFYDRGGHTYANLEFRRCRFVSCAISLTSKPERRSTVRNVRLVQCEQSGCAMYSAIIEDMVVDGFKTGGQLLQTWGAVFKHVTLRGNLGRLMISPFVELGQVKPHEQRAYDLANAAYYAGVDWALDISQARFQECEIQRIPAHLIRRDPASQVVVTREKVLSKNWRQVDLSGTHWHVSIEFMLKRGDLDVVLVAPKRHRRYKVLLEGLQRLRDAGVAEPD